MQIQLANKTHSIKAHIMDGFNIGFEYGGGWLQINLGIFRITIWFDTFAEF